MQDIFEVLSISPKDKYDFHHIELKFTILEYFNFKEEIQFDDLSAQRIKKLLNFFIIENLEELLNCEKDSFEMQGQGNFLIFPHFNYTFSKERNELIIHKNDISIKLNNG